MSALSAMETGAAKALGTVLAAGLLVAACVVPAYAVGAQELGPLKARPGGARGPLPTRVTTRLPVVVVVRLPDGRLLRFTTLPSTSGTPSSGPPGTGTPSGGASGSPGSGSPGSGSPSGAPSASGLPVPVVSSLFPSPSTSGSHSRKPSPSERPSRATPQASATTEATNQASAAPAQDVQGGDAVPPAVLPDRPASSVPPPLGPQAVLHPDPFRQQIAAPRAASTGAFAHRGRLLGVGLALIGTGAALFGWRIRRL